MMKRRCASHHWVRFVAATALAFVAVAIPASGEPAALVAVVAPSLNAQVSQVRPSDDGQRVLLGGSFGLVSVDVAQGDVTAVAPSSTGVAGIQAWAQSPTGSTVVWASHAGGSPMYENRIGAPPGRLRLSSAFSPNGLLGGLHIYDVYGMAVSATGQIYAFVNMVGYYGSLPLETDVVLTAAPGTTRWDVVPDPLAALLQSAYTSNTGTSPTQDTFATCTTMRRSDGPADNKEHDRFLLTVYEVVPKLRVTTATVREVQPFSLANSPAAGCSAADAGYGAFIISIGPEFQSKTFVLVAGHGQSRRVALGRYNEFIGLSPSGRIVASADGNRRLALTNVASRRQQVLVSPDPGSAAGQVAWSADSRYLILNDQWVINVTTDQWTKIYLPGVTATSTGYDACFTAGDQAVIEVQAGGSDGEQLYVSDAGGRQFSRVAGSGSLSPYQSSSLCAPRGNHASFYFVAGQPPSLYSGNAASLDGSPLTTSPTGTTGATGVTGATG
jgi:hypothetical protein